MNIETIGTLILALFAGVIALTTLKRRWEKMAKTPDPAIANTGLPCPDCKLINNHQWSCTVPNHIDRIKYMVQEIERLHKRRDQYLATHMRLEQQVTFWQGKWSIVKQENNKLRRQNYNLKHAKEIKIDESVPAASVVS